LHQVGKLFQI